MKKPFSALVLVALLLFVIACTIDKERTWVYDNEGVLGEVQNSLSR